MAADGHVPLLSIRPFVVSSRSCAVNRRRAARPPVAASRSEVYRLRKRWHGRRRGRVSSSDASMRVAVSRSSAATVAGVEPELMRELREVDALGARDVLVGADDREGEHVEIALPLRRRSRRRRCRPAAARAPARPRRSTRRRPRARGSGSARARPGSVPSAFAADTASRTMRSTSTSIGSGRARLGALAGTWNGRRPDAPGPPGTAPEAPDAPDAPGFMLS